MIDVGRALKAPFEDPEWLTKTLLGLLWGLLVVTAPAVYGAQIRYLRGVSRDDERLPSWNDFGALWVEGLLAMIAGFVYFLPALVLMALTVVPAVITYAASGNGDTGALAGGLFAGTFCFAWVAALIYIVAVSVLFSAALTNYAMKGGFGAFFEIGEILGRVRGGTGYFGAWGYTLLIALIGSVVTSAVSATGIGAVLSTGVTYLVAMASGHVLGQWAKHAYAGGAQPAAVGQAYPAPGVPVGHGSGTPLPPPAPPAPPAAPQVEPPETPGTPSGDS